MLMFRQRLGSVNRYQGFLRRGAELGKLSINPVKPCIDLVKPRIDLVKPCVDLVKPRVDSIKSCVDLFKSRINPFKSRIDSMLKLAKIRLKLITNLFHKPRGSRQFPSLKHHSETSKTKIKYLYQAPLKSKRRTIAGRADFLL